MLRFRTVCSRMAESTWKITSKSEIKSCTTTSFSSLSSSPRTSSVAAALFHSIFTNHSRGAILDHSRLSGQWWLNPRKRCKKWPFQSRWWRLAQSAKTQPMTWIFISNNISQKILVIAQRSLADNKWIRSRKTTSPQVKMKLRSKKLTTWRASWTWWQIQPVSRPFSSRSRESNTFQAKTSRTSTSASCKRKSPTDLIWKKR